MECGQRGEGIRLRRLANTPVHVPLPSFFAISSPRKFQDTGTELYLVLRLRLYGFVPLLLHKHAWCGAEISARKLHLIQGVPGGMDKTSGECSLC